MPPHRIADPPPYSLFSGRGADQFLPPLDSFCTVAWPQAVAFTFCCKAFKMTSGENPDSPRRFARFGTNHAGMRMPLLRT